MQEPHCPVAPKPLAQTRCHDYAQAIDRAIAQARSSVEDGMRPRYHIAPEAGTLADPNGMFSAGDERHLMFLNNPLACQTSERTPCVWMHLVTRDWVHYRRVPVALYPDTDRDRDGVYSGSALQRDGAAYLFYTGNVRHHGDFDYIHSGREQNVMRAESLDGTFERFGNKRLLMTDEDYPAAMTQHVRDPQVIEREGRLHVLLGARTLADEGCVLVYGLSDELARMELEGVLATAEPFGYMWECPDCIELDGSTYLLACPQGIEHEAHRYQNAHQCGYFALPGGLSACLTDASALEGGDCSLHGAVGPFEQWDYGFDFYAARTLALPDGRVLLQGWMGMPDAPYGRTPAIAHGWDQALAMPRELTVRDGRICQRPLRELNELAGPGLELDADAPHVPEARSFKLDVCLADPSQDLHIALREDAEIEYRSDTHEIVLRMGPMCGAGRDERRALVGEQGLTHIELYVDASTLELFVNDGTFTMTSRIFGDASTTRLHPFAGTATFAPMGGFIYEN